MKLNINLKPFLAMTVVATLLVVGLIFLISNALTDNDNETNTYRVEEKVEPTIEISGQDTTYIYEFK
jgi:hypothetical protein